MAASLYSGMNIIVASWGAGCLVFSQWEVIAWTVQAMLFFFFFLIWVFWRSCLCAVVVFTVFFFVSSWCVFLGVFANVLRCFHDVLFLLCFVPMFQLLPAAAYGKLAVIAPPPRPPRPRKLRYVKKRYHSGVLRAKRSTAVRCRRVCR